MKKLVIAEKKNLALALIEGLGKNNFTNNKEYYESETVVVTYARGHLLTLCSIEDYTGEKKWKMENLPFFPQPFKYKPIEDKQGFAKAQFAVIKKLIHRNDIDTIVHCGDPDREGELLIRMILLQAKNTKPVMRMWCQSIVPYVAKEAYENLIPDSNFDNWYNEGVARQHMDWIFGINLTQFVSLKCGSLMRVGRVLVPITKFVFDRDEKIKNFNSQKSYAVEGVLTKGNTKITLRDESLLFDAGEKSAADKMAAKLNSADTTVKYVKQSKETKRPMKLFSGIGLQAYLNKNFGIPMEQSLEAMQSLYNNGFMSYPRTNTEYITLAEQPNVAMTLNEFSMMFPQFALEIHSKKTVFDDSKCDGHTALTPTAKIPNQSSLTKNEELVYNSVLARFLSNFSTLVPEIDKTTVVIQNAECEYILEGEKIIDLGFLEIEPQRLKAELPMFALKENLFVEYKTVEKESQPPKPVTVPELTYFLQHPYKNELKQLKENDDIEFYTMLQEGCNLGTEATVTTIMGNCVKNEYIIPSGKNQLRIGEKGIALVNSLNSLGINLYKDKNIEFNKGLKSVFKGNIGRDSLIQLVENEIENIVKNGQAVSIAMVGDYGNKGKNPIGVCPKCGKNVYENTKAFSCEDRNCGFALWKDDNFFVWKGKKITASFAKELLKNGKCFVENCKKKDGNGTYDAWIIADLKDFSNKYVKFSLEFEKRCG